MMQKLANFYYTNASSYPPLDENSIDIVQLTVYSYVRCTTCNDDL